MTGKLFWDLLWLYLAACNVLSFSLMGADKRRARRHGRRVPERTLLLLDFLGGSLGGIAAMYLFRHKTLHWKFRLLPPLFLLLHLALLCWLRFGGISLG